MTDTFTLWISRRRTETAGVGRYSVSAFVNVSRSCIGVRPAAITSFSSGREIFPSGRTGTVRVSSGLSHTAMSRTSSGPMTYAIGQPPAAGCCACPGGTGKSATASRTPLARQTI